MTTLLTVQISKFRFIEIIKNYTRFGSFYEVNYENNSIGALTRFANIITTKNCEIALIAAMSAIEVYRT